MTVFVVVALAGVFAIEGTAGDAGWQLFAVEVVMLPIYAVLVLRSMPATLRTTGPQRSASADYGWTA